MLRNPNLLQPVGNGELQASITPTITFKAVCGTQSRMPEGFNLMLNQNQALSTPDNLVGGAVMRTIPTASSGLNHPTKGEAMSKLTGERGV